MEHFFSLLLGIASTALTSPVGIGVIFAVAFSGELGVSPPAVLEAAFTAVGVRLAHGSASGLILFPVVVTAAVLGVGVALWMSDRGVRLVSRFAKAPGWAQKAGFLRTLPQSSPLMIAVLRQLPGAQLPLTVLWSATRGPRRTFFEGVTLSVIIHWAAIVVLGAVSERLVGSSGTAFAIAFILSLVVSTALLVVAQLKRVLSTRGRPAVRQPEPPLG